MANAMFGTGGSLNAVREWRQRLGRAGPRKRRGRLARRPRIRTVWPDPIALSGVRP